MKIAIMQPYFFPYIGYWQLIHAADCFVIYDDVNYIKGGWINRNRILINGEPTYVTASLHQASPNKLICDTYLQPSPVWRNKLIRMVENTYRKSPCFAEVFPVIEQLVRHETDKLSDYLSYQLQALAAFIGIKTEFMVNSRRYKNNDLSGQERILDICKREGATTYINPQGGQSLYDHASFAESGIDLKFLIPSSTIEYKQFGSVHVPWLSIIDVMMFNSKSKLHTLLNRHELV
jgi:WbqC-like protein family